MTTNTRCCAFGDRFETFGRGRAQVWRRARRRYAAECGAGVDGNLASVYFTDRGIEELAARRGEEEVSLEWLAEQLRTFVDLNPEFETPIERFATWLARLDDDEE
jgi:hypothetical protein